MIERYQDPMLAEIWSREAEVDRWFGVEVAWMRQVRGVAAADLLEQIGVPGPCRIAAFEETTKHEVVAFLHALDERIRESVVQGKTARLDDCNELRQWLHYGLTSSDVIDTGLGVALKRSHDVLLEQATQLLIGLGGWCNELAKHPLVMGRTHGQYAAPMPAEHRWQVLYGMVVTGCRNLASTRTGLALGKLSGPVGVPLDEDQEMHGLRQLGLRPAVSSQVVPRLGVVHWAGCLAELATVCEAIATQVWLLAQQDVAELQENGTAGQVGSSAIPHKRNPIKSENIRGLARLVRMYSAALRESIVQWGEHDLAHSSVERVVLPDLCHTTAAILVRTRSLIEGLQIHRNPIPSGFVDTHASLMMRQRSGQFYVDAHAELRSLPYLPGKMSPDEDYDPVDPADAGVAHGTSGW